MASSGMLLGQLHGVDILCLWYRTVTTSLKLSQRVIANTSHGVPEGTKRTLQDVAVGKHFKIRPTATNQ